MSRISVCAVVVTYNRKDLLEKQIQNILFEQTYRIDRYYIVDNCSTDETEQMVERYHKQNPSLISYCKTQENCGGAGGFCYGLQKAFEDGHDWYILMDDDGRPFDGACFESVICLIQEHGYQSSEKYLLNSLVLCDENKLSFGLGHLETVDDLTPEIAAGVIYNKINPFNGTWISRGLIDAIGFPNGQFFIKGDETDYCRRALASKAIVATVVSSRYYHPRSEGYVQRMVLGHKMYVFVEAPWKEYYNVRNYTYSYLQFGKVKDALFHLIKRLYCCMVCDCRKLSVLAMMLKGFCDGVFGRLGAKVKP